MYSSLFFLSFVISSSILCYLVVNITLYFPLIKLSFSYPLFFSSFNEWKNSTVDLIISGEEYLPWLDLEGITQAFGRVYNYMNQTSLSWLVNPFSFVCVADSFIFPL
jgi:hypothetical protein